MLNNLLGVTKDRSDLIVYGATGFTGKKIALEIAVNPPSANGKPLKWAISGRDESKLFKVLDLIKELQSDPNRVSTMDLNLPEIVVVNVSQNELLVKSFANYKVLINCVGPFRLYGTPVVQACIAAKTHYVDICGETEFIEQIYADYNQDAIKAEMIVIPACGYDCVPADIGALFTKTEFEKLSGVCTQVEMFVEVHSGKSGAVINSTTLEAAMLSFANVSSLRELRKKTHRKLEYKGPTLHVQRHPGWNRLVSGWTVPAMVADVPVVKLSQQIIQTHSENYSSKKLAFNNKYKPPTLAPIQFSGYFKFQNFVAIVYLLYIGILFKITSMSPWFRQRVAKFPNFYTFGVFSSEGPTEQQLSECSFTQTFMGKGYSLKEIQGNQKLGEPSIQITTTCHGPEMGYVATPACVISAAALLLSPSIRSKIPFGALTPAAAFSNVLPEILKELNTRGGIEFKVVKK